MYPKQKRLRTGLIALLPLATFAISSPTSFSLTSSGSTVQLSWDNPTDIDFDHIILRRSEATYPTTTGDGVLVTGGTITNYDDTALSDSTYYYSIFAMDLSGNASDPSTGYAIIDTTAPTVNTLTPASGSIVPGLPEFVWNISDNNLSGGSIQLLVSGDPMLFGLAYQNTIFFTETGINQTGTQAVPNLREQVRYRGSNITDGLGNTTVTEPRMMTVDRTSPTIQYTSPIEDGGYLLLGETAILTAIASDTHLEGGHMHFFIGNTPDFYATRPDGGLYHGGNTPFGTGTEGGISVPNLPVGTYYRYAEATDIVSNYASGAIQSFTVVTELPEEETPRRSGGGGGATKDTCQTDLSPSLYDGLCFDSNGTPVSHREKIIKLLNPNVTPSDTGNYVTVAGFIRDVFALLDIGFYGTMPEAYSTTPVSEKLFTKVVKKLGMLLN